MRLKRASCLHIRNVSIQLPYPAGLASGRLALIGSQRNSPFPLTIEEDHRCKAHRLHRVYVLHARPPQQYTNYQHILIMYVKLHAYIYYLFIYICMYE